MPVPADNYLLSRNTSEAERLRIQHEGMLSCQGYYLHPDIQIPTQGARIADICTGSAIFLTDLASSNHDAEYHGFDISDSMYPADAPANVQLHIADIRQPFDPRWLGYFDVVHIRFIELAMKKNNWAPVLQNLVTLLKPGGWIQWVEDDRAVSVRHAARPVAPPGAARESLSSGKTPFTPPKLSYLDRFNRKLLPDARSDDMMYGYMNLDRLMADAEIGNLEQVGCDVYVVDRADDGGAVRRNWASMGMYAVWSMLQAYEAAGNKLADINGEELAEGFARDVDAGGHFITRVSVFTGMKRIDIK